jgi:transposase
VSAPADTNRPANAAGSAPHRGTDGSAALIEAARAAVRTKGSYFGAQYRQIARRRGPNKAAIAVAHSLIELVWHLLSTGEVFSDLGDDYFTKRQDPQRRARRLVTQLEELGFAVTLEAAPATTV